MMDYTEFLEEVRKTRRESTWKSYCMALDKFPEGTEEEIIDYIDKSAHMGSTKKANLRILRMALDYNGALTKGIKRIIKSYRPDESLQECPTDKQVEKVWDHLPSLREKAMFSLMAYMGFRVGEVRNLNLNDITDNGMIIIRKSKGHRPDIMPMVHKRVYESLRAYLHERRATDDLALFTGPHGRLALGYIKNLFTGEFKSNDLPQFHCHSLRRYFANSMYNNGVSLLDMQDNMRHKSPETTKRYLNLGQQNRIDAMRKTWGDNVSKIFA